MFSNMNVWGSSNVPRTFVRAYESRRFCRFTGRSEGTGSHDGAILPVVLKIDLFS